MRNVTAPNLALLAQRALVARDFISIWAHDFTTGAAVPAYFWNDFGDTMSPVLDPVTLLPVTRLFKGSGSLIVVDDIPLVGNLDVRNVNAVLNGVSTEINNYVRGYNLKGARVELHRGLYNPATKQLGDTAEIRFVGEIDQSTINTPGVSPPGQPPATGSVAVTLVSATRELTRSNAAKRSDEDQQLRHAGDNFFADAGVAGEWEIFWGQASGRAPTITVGSGNPAADAARKAGLRG